MPDIHDDGSGTKNAAPKPRIVPELTEELLRTIPPPIAAAAWQLILRDKRRSQQLAAATARAAKAERERDAWRSEAERRSTERNAAVRRIGLLRVWLDELGHDALSVDRRLRRETGTADATQGGLSATETDDKAGQAPGSELECERAAAGLSGPEAPAGCDNPNIDGTCRHLTCGRCKQHTNNSHQGHYWAWCKVTQTTREFHFCCPGDCELADDDTAEGR